MFFKMVGGVNLTVTKTDFFYLDLVLLLTVCNVKWYGNFMLTLNYFFLFLKERRRDKENSIYSTYSKRHIAGNFDECYLNKGKALRCSDHI